MPPAEASAAERAWFCGTRLEVRLGQMTEESSGKMTVKENSPEQVRIGVVLSAGGLRGAAHVGVLRELIRHRIPIDVIVGVSAGAVIAAYYAAVGLDLDELISDAERFRGRHLLTYSLNVHLDYRFEHALGPWCGVIPNRLRQLESASFDRLHHGVQCLGIACHDLCAGGPRYFWTGSDQGAQLHTVVRASASIPHLFPAVPVVCAEEPCRLTDGGLSDPVPIAFSRGPAIGATHVIVSDCRWIGMAPVTDDETVWIRPRMPNTGTLWSPRRGLLAAVRNGEAAVNDEVLARIGRWFDRN
jgi:predicted acylesterase/phospholipase RssA